MITQNGKTIHLTGREISYVMFEDEQGNLLNFHFGKKIADLDYSEMKEEWEENLGFVSNLKCMDVYPQEYPSYGYTDLRNPAYQVMNRFGNMVSELKVKEYRIHKDAVVEITGMPALLKGGASADTLEVVLEDVTVGLEVHLFYTVFEEYNVIARNAVLVNVSDAEMSIRSAYSASVDLPQGEYDVIHFPGTWGRERDQVRTHLTMGMKAELESARGGSSSQLNPFVMIATPDADEVHGEVYGFALVYSGNHSTVAKIDQFGYLRVQQGINPHQFEWKLAPGERFETPQSILCFSDCGFGKMSREYHDLIRGNLMRSEWADKDRPVLINNWEGTYFNFTEEKLLAMADKAAEVGLDLFVLDDGWFGKRDNDRSGLGDWFVNKRKLPSGIDGLAAKMNEKGLKFGLWFEPEMVNPDSDLYRAHPDWAVHVEERTPALSRHQMVLDLSRGEVCEYVIKVVSDILENANVEYVKWDMNRQITDMPCNGYNHKYTLGYYKIMSAITERFPHILFEGCSSGGARFDLGVLAYMPQIWASDNSDAIARLKIQYSTSMCYPISTISAHVTASPNHQNGRVTSLKTRADVAYMGAFGYELDITKMSEEELETVKEQIKLDKQLQELMRTGDFYRILSPYDTNYCSWQVVSKDRKKVFLFVCRVLTKAQTKEPPVKLQGLDGNAVYRNTFTGKEYPGSMLMHKGIRPRFKWEDFATDILVFERVE